MKVVLRDLDNWLKQTSGTLFVILCNLKRASVGPEDWKKQTLNQLQLENEPKYDTSDPNQTLELFH